MENITHSPLPNFVAMSEKTDWIHKKMQSKEELLVAKDSHADIDRAFDFESHLHRMRSEKRRKPSFSNFKSSEAI